MYVDTKHEVIEAVESITELLAEEKKKLASVPRNLTAARQLDVIVNRLQGWRKTFGPVEDKPMEKDSPYTERELAAALKAYRKRGYMGLTREQKAALRWFDENFPTQG